MPRGKRFSTTGRSRRWLSRASAHPSDSGPGRLWSSPTRGSRPCRGSTSAPRGRRLRTARGRGGHREEDMGMAELEVARADVTKLEVDAIANAANTELKHGGGVAAAISRAGGPELRRESDEKAPIGLGEAVETTAGDMPARWVIHAATMELGGPTSAEIIERATRSTLDKAEELGARSLGLVAFG